MSIAISLCILCREETVSRAELTLENMRRSFPDTWAEILFVDFYFRRTTSNTPHARVLQVDDDGEDPIKTISRNSRGQWLFFMEAGEYAKAGTRFLKDLLTRQALIYVPLSSGDEDGWQPALSPRLIHRNIPLHGNVSEKNVSYLWVPFAVARKGFPTFDLFPSLFKTVGELTPGSHYLQAEKELQRGNHKKALDSFNRAYLAAIDPDLRRLYYYKKLVCLLKSGGHTAILQQLDRTKYPGGLPVELLYLKSLVFMQQRCHREALTSLEETETLLEKGDGVPPWAPEDFVIRTDKARMQAALQQPDKSMNSCRQALSLNPCYYPALELMAKDALRRYPESEGIQHIQRNAFPFDKRRFAILGRIFLENHIMPQARSCLDKGLEEMPGNPELLYLKALTCIMMGDAQACLHLAAKISAGSCLFRDAFLLRCLCLWRLGDFRKALQTIQSLRNQNSTYNEREFCRQLHSCLHQRKNPPSPRPRLFFLEKNSRLFLEFLEMALWEKEGYLARELISLAKAWDHGAFSIKVAKLLAQKKKEDEALIFFNKALQKDVYDGESLLILGEIAQNHGLFQEARGFYALARKSFPGDFSIHLAYAQALVKEAAHTLQAGLQLKPGREQEAILRKALKSLSYLEALKLNL